MPRVDREVLVTTSYPDDVPDLNQLLLPIKLVRGVRLDRIEVLKKISKSIHHTCYLHHPKKYLIGKEGTTGCHICIKPKVAHKGLWFFTATLANTQTTPTKASWTTYSILHIHKTTAPAKKSPPYSPSMLLTV